MTGRDRRRSDEAELRDRVRALGAAVGADADSLLARPAGRLDRRHRRPGRRAAAGARATPASSRVMCQHLLHDDLDAVALIGEPAGARVVA